MTTRGQVVAITGASSGLGRALALEVARRGASALALMARRADELESLADEVRALGAQALVLSTDVQDQASVSAAVEAAVQAFGRIDIAVANAGIGVPSKATDLDLGLLRETFEVNFFGAVRLMNAVLPAMLERSAGQLVVVSSVASYRGLPNNAAYSSSKAALSNLVEAWGQELPRRGVQVSLVEPGFIRTTMTEKNRFKMPFLMEVDAAARALADGIERGDKQIVFPWQMGLMMGVLKRLPTQLFFKLGAVALRSKDGWSDSKRPPV